MKSYYMQDARSYVGNSMVWWAKGHKGYCCDIRKAHIFTYDDAKKATRRDTDVLWDKKYIDNRISHHIDTQHCDRKLHGFTMDHESSEVLSAKGK